MSASDPQLSNFGMPFWVNTPMGSAALEAGTAYMLVATAPGTPNDTGEEFVEQLYGLPFRINAADQAETPEPATWAGLGMGLLALGALKRRRS